jgi:hypothetical protein
VKGDEEFREVVSNEPLFLDRPLRRVRRFRLVLVAYAVAIIVCSAVAAYTAAYFADRNLRDQVAAIDADRAANRAKIVKQQDATAALVEQARQALCALIQRTPPDAEINRQRVRYRCGPYLPPSAPGRDATQTPTPGPGSSTGPPTPPPPRTPPTVAPHPTPTPTPSPSPTQPHLICVLSLCI